jgi:hypothetical protein
MSMQAASPAAFAVSKAMEQPQLDKFASRLGRAIRRYGGEFAELVGSPKMKGWREPIIARGGMVTAAIVKTAQ